MGLLDGILYGFQVAAQPANLLFCFIGVLIGTLVGVLPGIGPVGAISLLLPSTFFMTPTGAIIMLGGIYYGAQYGGSTTSILVNIPGESTSVVTCLDGYQMALKGRAGPALGMAAFSSFIGGTLSVIALTLIATPMAELALRFGPPELFSLMFLAVTVLIFMGRGALIKSLTMAAFGLFLGWVGMDMISGQPRFTFGIMDLMDGIGLVPMLMGVFGIAEVLSNVEKSVERSIFQERIKGLLPTRKDWQRSLGPILRASLLGFFFGILPGSGGIVSTFASYTLEKKISKYPEKFGTGVIEGVAGPEAANNASTGGAYIPLLTLGIPSNVSMAVLLGALMIYGVQPGPLLLEKNPDLFWGVITSLYIGNLMLLILNLPLISLWVQILRVPYPFLYPMIILFCFIGAYSLNNSIFEVGLMAGFGVFGYLLKKLKYEPAPLVLGMVLGPMFENALRQTLLLSRGDFSILFQRPIAAIFTAAALLLIFSPALAIFKIRLREKISPVNKD